MTLSRDRLSIPSFSGGPPREIPILTVDANQPGPTVVITANIHGDEVTGLGAIHSLSQTLASSIQCGRIHLYPSLNPDGLAARTRKVPPDGQDLNRLFPGQAQGSPVERMAHIIWEDLASRKPDVVIDLHADSPISIPYAITDRAIALEGLERQQLEQTCESLAEASGLTVLREYPDDQYTHYGLQHSLAGAITNNLRIPAITIECGPRLYIQAQAVKVVEQAVLGILTAQGLLNHKPEPHDTQIQGGPWKRGAGPRASVAGIVHHLVSPGTEVSRGQAVAEVRSLAGDTLERLCMQEPGFVISLTERAWVGPGVSACTLATAEPPQNH
ncbi:MAG: succinylglutamate desuccinylase/aspartoacylase family protein [Myxococcota bacterium]|nr:succinylglutamate desuccinylase/aspartoacylase family protein [Myxococcota bacterium]